MVWESVGNLKGPEGERGARGEDGPPGPRGTKWVFGTGTPTDQNTADTLPGDVYVDATTGDVYQLN